MLKTIDFIDYLELHGSTVARSKAVARAEDIRDTRKVAAERKL